MIKMPCKFIEADESGDMVMFVFGRDEDLYIFYRLQDIINKSRKVTIALC
jgi:hypothetical protein